MKTRMGRTVLALLCLSGSLALAQTSGDEGTRSGEWPSYGGDLGSTRYAPLDQINAGQPRLAVEKYVGVDRNGNKTYTQHNPFAQNGPEAFIAFVVFFKGLFPDLNVRIVRTIAQCDLVMTHAHITTGPLDLGNAAMDIFRFDRTGRIVEHWDAVQPVEANSANDNTQF